MIRVSIRTSLLIGAVVLVTMAASSAFAQDKYTEGDSGYLRIASRVVQPVGMVIEGVFVRPFTALMSWSDPIVDHDERKHHPRECYGQRPHRACTYQR